MTFKKNWACPRCDSMKNVEIIYDGDKPVGRKCMGCGLGA